MPEPCALCARHGVSCCQNYQILLTAGDITRIESFTGSQNFWVTEYPVSEDIEPDYDPLWLSLILQPDGCVRVLKRTPDKKCILLSRTGCTLPPDLRPLICRLYPYRYTEQGIFGIDSACPISREKNWETVLCTMAMPKESADQWRSLLYTEIRHHGLPVLGTDSTQTLHPECTEPTAA